MVFTKPQITLFITWLLLSAHLAWAESREPSLEPSRPINIQLSVDYALTQFIAAVQNADATTAANLVALLLDELEGTLPFDFYYGLFLIEQQAVDEAIYALERVLFQDPNQPRVRLELARAYFIQGNLNRSRNEFNQVLASNPPKAVQQSIQIFLNRIAALEAANQKQRSAFLSLESGWNSNINGGGNNETLDPNIANLTQLTKASLAKESAYGRFSSGVQWRYPKGRQSTRALQLGLQHSYHPNDSAFDQSDVSIQLSHQHKGARFSGLLQLSSSFSWLDAEPTRASLAFSSRANYEINSKTALGLQGSVSLTAAQQNNGSDSRTDQITLLLNKQGVRRQHNLTLGYRRYHLEGDNNGHLEWQGIDSQYGLNWRWTNPLSSSLSLTHSFQHYEADDLFFIEEIGSNDRKRRQDHTLQLGIGVSWSMKKWLQSKTQVNQRWRNSNINAYNSDRWLVSQTLILNF